MTRRRFYAPPEAFSPHDKSVTLGADETRHLRDVLRLQLGDEAYVFDGTGNENRCAITRIERASCRLSVIEQVAPASPESPLNLTLAVALLKGEKFDLVVQKATELGVNSVIPVITERADVRIKSDDDAHRKLTRWQRIAHEATKQCGRARLMKIEAPTDSATLIDQPLTQDEGRFMFAERDGDRLESVMGTLAEAPTRVTALIGSEGGFSDDEIERAGAAGWKVITLGGRIVRAETAAIVIAALVQHRLGDLN